MNAQRHTTAKEPQADITISPLQLARCERRKHRRHDLEEMTLNVERWDGKTRAPKPFGQIVDISAGGIRLRTNAASVRVDQQIRVRLNLPDYAGICPFVEKGPKGASPKHEWVGWMSVARVYPVANGQVEVAGRLVDMDDMDRGMLGLYLSTQPLAA